MAGEGQVKHGGPAPLPAVCYAYADLVAGGGRDRVVWSHGHNCYLSKASQQKLAFTAVKVYIVMFGQP